VLFAITEVHFQINHDLSKPLHFHSILIAPLEFHLYKSMTQNKLTFTELELLIIMLIENRVLYVGRIQTPSWSIGSGENIRLGSPRSLRHAELLLDRRNCTWLLSDIVNIWTLIT
jgi:hypothetical protein